ncbi:MAG: AAA family ATPase [Candidatus Aminicenantes bacterium]|nr:AAA family ATPase [Candidatus Aminicenantes bacterium]NIM84259.1 AAA family ATPase [Candidatus Aminicenantes bacterium]NIN23708.1 AAA family ATPase [Candidatus Aminicenantes bacterium]NIN47415.1 AAA family ATPase [Candidatus Aminicenantes bacterium]NIN90343.1 AAA family ATPase [Candidatus Aminicenantes bacterium]
MSNDKFEYRKDVAFINREKELAFLKSCIDERSESILFLHGPKSSGKTTLLYKFFNQIEKEQKMDVKFLNLRKVLIGNYKDFLEMFFGVDYSRSKEDVKEKREYDFKFFKLSVEVLKGIKQGELDPFFIMEKEFIRLNKKGIKPVLIIDELQALDNIYLNNGRDRQLIIELFNFFVAMTKESHLAHIIISSSDGYFIDRVFIDSRLKKCSKFYRIDYLPKQDVMEWLLNLEKYSKIKDYTLSEEDAEKIWQTVGGSMWEIQDILSELFHTPLDEVTRLYKKKMRSLIVDYVVKPEQKKIEKLLRRFVDRDELSKEEINSEEEELLRDMVRQNILYFDPAEATYYPQGKSYHHGIRLYFTNTLEKFAKKNKDLRKRL